MNLLRLELRKLLPYRAFWVLMGLYAVVLVLVFNSVQNISFNGSTLGEMAYRFPQVWQTVAFIASFFNLLLGILVIVMVTDEYSFRTFRQQLIDGLSRFDLVVAKAAVIVSLALLCTAFVAALGYYYGLKTTPDSNHAFEADSLKFVGGYFIQATTYMALAMLIALLLRKSGLSIVAFLLYGIAIEPLIRWQLPDNIDKYFPSKIISSMTPMPRAEMLEQAAGISNETLPVNEAMLVGGLYTLFFLALAYLVLKMRDL